MNFVQAQRRDVPPIGRNGECYVRYAYFEPSNILMRILINLYL